MEKLWVGLMENGLTVKYIIEKDGNWILRLCIHNTYKGARFNLQYCNLSNQKLNQSIGYIHVVLASTNDTYQLYNTHPWDPTSLICRGEMPHPFRALSTDSPNSLPMSTLNCANRPMPPESIMVSRSSFSPIGYSYVAWYSTLYLTNTNYVICSACVTRYMHMQTKVYA